MSDEITVHHDGPNNRYEIKLEGKTAYMQYRRDGNVSTFVTTVTPTELQGRGLASRLVKRALNDAREQGVRVVPQCSFVRVYIDRHAEYADLVAR